MKKILAAAFISLILFFILPLVTIASPLAYPTERISGQDRIETALSISQKGWTTAQTVLLSEFTSYADSIAAAPLAASLDAPILLSAGNTLDQRVVQELQRLKPQRIILLGGKTRLQKSIESELNNLALSWERIAGLNRYETSVKIAQHFKSDSLLIANGDDFPDALSAASYAGIKKIPIILTSKKMPPSVASYLKDLDLQQLIVIGGEAAVPSSSLSPISLTIETRLGGENRYETNAQVVKYMQNAVDSDDFFLASGQNFPDAIAGVSLAAKLKTPLILTEKDDIPPAIYELMRKHMKVEPSLTSTQSGRGQVTATGGLNLRDTPSASGKLILTIPEGTTLDITASQGQWYKTSLENLNGWVSASYINITHLYKQGRITASGGLNLRENPSTSADILMTIPRGAITSITESQNDWHKVCYRETSGWVHADYVTILPTGNADGSIDLSPNGRVLILGGSNVISPNTQGIIEGKLSSHYPQNLKDFPSLPSSLNGNDSSTGYDPTQEILLDPFAGITAENLKGKKIVIDPGHGGPDSGAIGPSYTFEKDNNLAIACFLRDILTQAGAAVSMTRESDACLALPYHERADLQARVAIANKIKPDLFISLHNNANSNPDNNGTSTYYSVQNTMANESGKLASLIQNMITGKTNTNDEGVRTANFYVLRYTQAPAILVEVAYLSNAYEEERLKNPIFQKNVATAVFHGISEYFK